MITQKQIDKREYFRSLCEGLECLVCGDDATLFHHRNPAEREFGISEGHYSRSKMAIIRELARCDPLCHRCHVEAHRELRLQRIRRMNRTLAS